MEIPETAGLLQNEKGHVPPGHAAHGLTVLTTAVFAVGEMAGSGVLALPKALVTTGWTGVAINIVCAAASAYTGMILGKCWLMVQNRYVEYQTNTRYPYPAIGFVTYGKAGRMLVSASINLTLFGVAVVFLLLASQNLQHLVSDAGHDFSFCYWLLIVAAALLPTTWLGTPKDFWPIAVGATVATSIACVIIVANVAVDSVDLPPAFKPELDAKNFFMAFGTICFAFGGHPGFPTFQADMKQPEKFGKAIFLAYSILLLMYLPVAISGYIAYGVNASDNILENLSSGPMHYLVDVLITLHLFFGFVIVLNPVCQEVEEIVGIPPHFTFKRILSRTAIMLLVLFIAESIPHFGAILSLIGGSTTTLLAYILPPIFYLKLCSMKGDWEEETPSLMTKVLLAEIMLVGTVAGVASTYAAVDALATSSFSTPCYISTRHAGD
ncbi:amino acid transporter antl1-like isoform x1 [Plakobranchus ocellatus]|uniref:Amino acid transporter antl1-like isoform x1 n=1 Tax=Plakobranchus ocellatus TaxID=259542 RepID=A0AAV3XY60_9GAST|nr:amino acid transporter antl1-like isoform x1 [Plakobranchus ocellatus]